ncbi:hypothetical protein SAMN05661093_02979 [Kibdelosporangium aridum]|uniref:Uncharacterized protein n=1 Tax=Kibdelosporangium aridum TaxID=2030 RepID=A0A1Y5XGX2_KIBAR|nr:hypothetical protein SAMN05661093_02979 [Kibdelosporangium aridum]
MAHVLAAVLRAAMVERLAGLTTTDFGNLTSAVREILELHQPDCKGRCRECTGWPRNRKFPCRVWLIAHRHLLIPPPNQEVRHVRH